MSSIKTTQIKILDAAAAIVELSGASHLTIDAVAKKSGLSKGGVLYHYPSKQALLEGMLNRLVTARESRSALTVSGRNNENGINLESFVAFEFEQKPSEKAQAQAILAAASENPSLLEPARNYLRSLIDRVASSGVKSDLAKVVFLATEGLQLLELVDLIRLEPAERQRIQSCLTQLAQEIQS
ncbi:MAG: TetR/AcrR family transcriptional regulator [Pseudomonadales bacterium]|nr:TetR/AcrR family transcriptional regulator [Pseudomonadales bacterium]